MYNFKPTGEITNIGEYFSQVVHGSHKTIRTRITKSKFGKFMFHGKHIQLITRHKNTPVRPQEP